LRSGDGVGRLNLSFPQEIHDPLQALECSTGFGVALGQITQRGSFSFRKFTEEESR
jgi:hypothetical protein